MFASAFLKFRESTLPSPSKAMNLVMRHGFTALAEEERSAGGSTDAAWIYGVSMGTEMGGAVIRVLSHLIRHRKDILLTVTATVVRNILRLKRALKSKGKGKNVEELDNEVFILRPLIIYKLLTFRHLDPVPSQLPVNVALAIAFVNAALNGHSQKKVKSIPKRTINAVLHTQNVKRVASDCLRKLPARCAVSDKDIQDPALAKINLKLPKIP
ncbi:hypothetical protein B0H19DRAFT_1060065 [Mycena capillaripes]|nr:hypothetical protein B0H19DRAFT_1060065 [Mycena capillaripes]